MTIPAPLRRRPLLQLLLLFAALTLTADAAAQQLAFAGLRSAAQQGQFNAVQTDAAGNLYLLLDEKDGVRLLKTDNAAQTVLAQAKLGAAGDIGLAMALDPSGNVYIAGTTTSTTLTATAGAAITTRADGSTNTFVARFDASLNPVFVTLAGGSRIVPTGIAATADAVFITGFTYGANLPVTASAIQQAPAYASSQNGFAERFNSAGSQLVYATYLSGANGDTAPAAIAADASDNAYIAGETSATGYPTVAAVVPAMLGSPSGFLTKLTPAGDGIAFSTFIPGSGITSVAVGANVLALAGGVSFGQFPIDTVTAPLVPATWQALVRMPLDGSTVLSSTAIAPGAQTSVAFAPDGTLWVDGVFSAPLLPVAAPASVGQAFAAHVNAQSQVDRTARLGGLPNGNPSFASLPIVVTSLGIDPAGEPLVAGGVQPTAGSSLLATQTYDLPLLNAPTAALPSTLRSAIPATASCNGSLCPGYAAYLAKLNPAGTAPALALSVDAAPFVTLRNLGTAVATGLQIAATGPAVLGSSCGTTLNSGAECSVLLNTTAGSLTVSAANAGSQTVTIPASTAPASTILFAPREIDFGIQSSTSPAATRTVTVTNLGQQSQSFPSNLDSSAKTASPFTQTSTDCTLSTANTYTLPAGGSCHITLAFTALSTSVSDGFLQAQWLIGARDVVLTGYTQAAALSVSSTEIDFGTQIGGGLRLPRYLYLSNNSASAVAHTAVTLPASSPFTVADACPATLAPASVCRIQLNYLSSVATSTDSVTMALDDGISVLVTGQTLPAKTGTATSVNPNLTVTPVSVSFANAVPVTGVSNSTQTVGIANTGASSFTLNLALSGDFTDSTNCGATLAGGASCSVVVSFVPGQPGTRDGLLAVTAGANTTPAYTTLTGSATAILPANNGTLAFGSEPVGQPTVQWYKISQPFSALTATTTGPFAVLLVEDTGYGHGQPSTAAYTNSAAGSCLNCYLGLEFTPTATGVQTGSLSLSSASGGNPYVLALTGTGTASTGLILTPLAQDFGTVALHSRSAPVLFQLTNATTAPVTLPAPAVTGDFVQSTAPSGGQTCAAGPLAAAATCYLQLAFVPTATGARSGTLTFGTSSGTVASTLTGFGGADPGVSFSPVSLTFLNVPSAAATVQTITIGNTGTASIQIGAPTTSTTSFAVASTCSTLAAGATCGVQVTFTPSTATVADTLQIPVTTASGSATYTVPLSGAYTSENAGLQILPLQMEYGPQAVGSESVARQITITNLTAKSLTLNVVLPRQFVLTGSACAGLAPNASCSFPVAFLPLTNGDVPGTIFAQGTPTDSSATLNGIGYVEGYGVGTATLALPLALGAARLVNFGQVVSGQTLTALLTLTNTAATPLTVRRITSQAPFFTTTTCGATLAQGQTCTASVVYTPINQVATGTTSPATTNDAGVLVIESDAASSPDTVTLAGSALPIAVASPVNVTPLATFAVSQSSLTFASTQVGKASAPQVVTLSNTGTSTIHILSLQTTTDFSLQSACGTLVAGSSCNVTVTFLPQSTGTHAAALEIGSDSVTPLEFVSLLGPATPSSLALSPAVLAFGLVPVGTTVTLPVQVTNQGTTPIVFAAVTVTGDYAVSGNCPAAGASLAAAATCTLQVAFSPTAEGARSGTLSVGSSASVSPLTVPLTGTGGLAHLLVAPGALAFGSLSLGQSTSLTVTLTNTGAIPLRSLALSTTGDFSIAVPCGATSLAAGASCTVQVNFTPTVVGPRTGVLTIVSTDSGSPASIPLTGTAVAGGGFTLTVDGGASSSASVSSGNPATYQLVLTPTGGFTGTVALTCNPVAAAAYASCSLLPPSLTLAGSAQTSVATINTITSVAAAPAGRPTGVLLCLLAPAVLLAWRRRARLFLLAMMVGAMLGALGGCGGGSPANPHLRYTPAGSYQFQITASSTAGPSIVQSVNVTLTVQ
ncbi:Beta-propeller repeat-containing protein [Granulicella rosea]|uniref:Beta-propeller repeat-containing protein n=1 Tax=Granulicella rosea TaxID=474952 RepID=A0A239H9Q7_9BACT|nr:choice-of-anchor D domain-containing protein [Granulicella rosea]SNS78129.1 Beta-propeller repeat-containing protein [Granulicella rosea]